MSRQDSYKATFYIPFFLWVLGGAISLFIFTQEELFFYLNSIFKNEFVDYFFYAVSGMGRGEVLFIILISLLLFPVFRNKKYILTAGLTAIFTAILNNVLKLYFKCPRPLSVFLAEQVNTLEYVEPLYWLSFPSGHTMGAFALCCLLSILLPKKYKLFAFILFALALLCGLSRIYLGLHFFHDVYAGSLIGVGLSSAIYYLVNRFAK